MNTEGNALLRRTAQSPLCKADLLCDNDFIEQLNDLSLSIKEFIKKGKKEIEYIKANLTCLSENTSSYLTLLSEIDKDNCSNRCFSSQIAELSSSFKAFPELNNCLRQNSKEMEMSIEDFFLKAKIIFNKLKLKRQEKKEQLKNLNLHTESTYYVSQRQNKAMNDYCSMVTSSEWYDTQFKGEHKATAARERNRSSGLNRHIPTRGGTFTAYEYKPEEYSTKEFAERVYGFMKEMTELQESIINKTADIAFRKKKFEIAKTSIVKRVEELLGKKVVRRDTKPKDSAKYTTDKSIKSSDINSTLMKAKTQRDNKEINHLLSLLEKLTEENAKLKTELKLIKTHNEEQSQTEVDQYREGASSQEKLIARMQDSQIKSEDKIKQFQIEIASLRKELNGLQDKHRSAIEYKEKQLALREIETINRYEELLKQRDENIATQKRLTQEAVATSDNKEKDYKKKISDLSQRIKVVEELNSKLQEEALKKEAELQLKTIETLNSNQLLQEMTLEFDKEKEKREQIAMQYEDLLVQLNQENQKTLNQQAIIKDLEQYKEEHIKMQQQHRSQHDQTISQLKADLLNQKEQLAHLKSTNEYLSQALEEIKIESKQLTNRNDEKAIEITALSNQLHQKNDQVLNQQGHSEMKDVLLRNKLLEEENNRLGMDILKLKRDISLTREKEPNYSIIHHNQIEKEEKDNNSFEEELNKVFDKEVTTSALPHSQIHINQKELSNPSFLRNQNATVGLIQKNEEKQRYLDIIHENKIMFNVQQEQLKYFQQLEKENQGKFFQLKELFNQLIKELKIPKANKHEFFLILKFIGYSNEDIKSILKKKGLS